MTTSATQDFLSEIVEGKTISGSKLAYFQARLNSRVHQLLLKLFRRLEEEQDFTRRELASRIGRKPEQITRWLSYPGNLTLDTISDLLVGMGCEMDISPRELSEGKSAPIEKTSWLYEEFATVRPITYSSAASAAGITDFKRTATAESVLSAIGPKHRPQIRPFDLAA